MTFRSLGILGIQIIYHGCKPDPELSPSSMLSDPQASPMATSLYKNLQRLSANNVLLGHQDALAYGMGWKGEAFRTDIHDVLGDHPAIFGWDLFRFTIDYLRDKGLHQLIIAYSSDRFQNAEQYMEFYPGDDYVDVMAFDDYHGLASKERTPGTIHMLEILDSLSTEHGKIMVISETGLETIPDHRWFTDVVLHTLNSNESTRKASWILFWRNGRPDHFDAPYPGHPVVPDFIEFMDHELMLSLSELPDLYH